MGLKRVYYLHYESKYAKTFLYGRKYDIMSKLLVNILPFAFLYGLRTPKLKRKPHKEMSFMFLITFPLDICHSELLGEMFSKIPFEDLQEAANETKPQQAILVITLMKSILRS